MALTTPPSPTSEQPSELKAKGKEHELSNHSTDGLEAEKKKQELSTPLSDDLQPDTDQVSKLPPDASLATQEQDWVSGLRLTTIMIAVTLVVLLSLLDASIIATACFGAFLSLVHC